MGYQVSTLPASGYLCQTVYTLYSRYFLVFLMLGTINFEIVHIMVFN